MSSIPLFPQRIKIGTQGSTGTQVATGLQGTTGAQGVTGAQGATGLQGTVGIQGVRGAQGVTGTKGVTGAQGVTGTKGATGLQGDTGAQGVTGAPGTAGLQGDTGAQGATGLQGDTGAQGVTGVPGTAGAQGATGLQGVAGSGDSYWQPGSTGIYYNNQVGIGTSSISSALLYIDSSILSGNDINALHIVGGSTGNTYYILDIFTPQNNNYYLSFTQSGDLSYHNPPPGGTGTGTNIWTIQSNGDATFNTVTTSSDYRIKEDIVSLNLDENSVDKLNPVKFKFKNDGKESIGLIAHELQEHYPFLVEGEKDGIQTQSVNYNGLVGILIKEIQEIKKTIKDLKNELNEIKNVNNV